MKRVVAAIDGSEASNRVIDFAAEFSVKFGAGLTLIYVVEYNWPPDWAMAEYARPENNLRAMAEFAESVGRECLKEAKARAIGDGAAEVSEDIRFGDPAGEILKCCETSGADAVVLASRGRGRLTGRLLGSVSQKIALHAPCTVIIVR